MQIKSAEREGDDTAVSNSAQKVIRVKIKFEVVKYRSEARISSYYQCIYIGSIHISSIFLFSLVKIDTLLYI